MSLALVSASYSPSLFTSSLTRFVASLLLVSNSTSYSCPLFDMIDPLPSTSDADSPP